MPEGDTVFRTAARLHQALAGEPLTTTDLRWPDLSTLDFRGVETLEVVSRGKNLLQRLGNGVTIHSHLRMEGQWRVEHPGPDTDRALRRPDVRAAVLGARWSAVGLRLGMLDLVPTSREADDLAAALRRHWNVDFDDAGAIGRRYRRQDEIGTPFCVTVDFDTLTDQAVTIRERDTMAQERVALDQVESYLAARLPGC